jgi:hypothetical protein
MTVAYKQTGRTAYRTHMHNAARRRIPFELTFSEWVDWWVQQLGPDFMNKRGRRRDQYHMATFEDRGPYKLGNVKCVTSSQNHSERWVTPEQRAAITTRLKGNKYTLGYKHTPEARAKMSIARMGPTPENLEEKPIAGLPSQSATHEGVADVVCRLDEAY